MKKSLLFTAVLALASCMSFTACSDDDDSSSNKLIIDPDAGGNKLKLEYDMKLNLTEGYEGKQLDIDLGKIAEFFSFEDSAALVTAMKNNDISMFGLKADGEVDAERGATSTNGTWGHWCTADGSPCTWGDDAYVFAEFNIDEENGTAAFYCGQFPGRVTEATTISITEGLAVDVDTVLVKINFIIAAEQYTDPETAPAGAPQNAEYTITVDKAYADNYSFDNIDVKEQLREAFKMTTYQLYQANKANEINAYINVKADTVPSYTADAPGYWMTSEGQPGAYNGGCFWFSLYFEKEAIYMGGGNHPEWTSGTKANFDFIVTYKDVAVTYHVTYNLAAKAAIVAEKAAEYTLSTKIVADTAKYDGATIELDETVAKTALGCDSLGAVVTIDANGLLSTTQTANNGFWYNANGVVDNYGNSVLFIEYATGKLNVGQYPAKLKAGEKYAVKFGFLNPAADKYVMYTVNVDVE